MNIMRTWLEELMNTTDYISGDKNYKQSMKVRNEGENEEKE
jgi:hypothetical protein